MRVLQLIDSLHAGGAERVAVNIANALASQIDKSHICATREEGLLKNSIRKETNYFFLNKQRTIDIKAAQRLLKYVKDHKIDIIHAHSSSFFLATIIKLCYKKVGVIWHDHYGNSEYLQNRDYKILRLCSFYFFHVFSVNKALKIWTKANLRAKTVSYLPNFAIINESKQETILKGVKGKRIICLANLRIQKDHITLFKAFKVINEHYPDWTLHCIGKDFNDDYSKEIKQEIKTLNLENHVFLYGSKPDVKNILSQCDIGVLSSKSEGLPIALLEYGLAGLPTIATDVGECAEVVAANKTGLIVQSGNTKQLMHSIKVYIEDEKLRLSHASELKSYVSKNYSEASVIEILVKTYNALIDIT